MPPEETYPLELSDETFRSMIEKALEHLLAHLGSLDQQPVVGTEGGRELALELREPLPREGVPFDELLDLLFERVFPCTYNTASGGYLAYVPGGGIPHSAVADFLANGVNRFVGLWLAGPGIVQLEANVVRWFCDLVGYPDGAGGFLTSGGSLANLSAVVTARRERLPENFLRGTLYTSDQVHHSVTKAAMLAGFPVTNVRQIPTDSRFEICLDRLREQIATDRREGFEPFLVVGNAGSTNTGAVDDLEALATIAAKERLWFHADAAYGGFFALTERGRRALRGLDRADSVTLDPHKGLFLPYGTGCLLVREAAALKRTHSTAAEYLPQMQEDLDWVDYCEISPELSRDFRGLRAWLPLKMHGIGPFRAALNEKLDLAQEVARELKRVPDIEVLAEPPLSLVVFRLAPAEVPAEDLNRLNRDFLEEINRPNRVFLTPTTLPDGRFVLRICILSFRTHRRQIEWALEYVRQAAKKVLGVR